jgi:hypothetical protein
MRAVALASTACRQRSIVLLTALTAGTPATAQPQPAAEGAAPPAVGAVRSDVPPIIDGDLDEPCWAAAPGVGRVRQVFPVEGAAPSERTEVRILFDADNLYIAAQCFDSDPAAIIARQMARDGAPGSRPCPVHAA